MARSRSVDARERDFRALELRRLHLTYAQIAREMGWKSPAAAHGAVQRALAASIAEPAAEVRQIALERLDDLARHLRKVLARRHYVISQAGKVVRLGEDDGSEPVEDSGPVIAAVLALLRVEESRRKLLGLDAPTRTRVQVITEDAVDEAIAALSAELAGNDGDPAHTGTG